MIQKKTSFFIHVLNLFSDNKRSSPALHVDVATALLSPGTSELEAAPPTPGQTRLPHGQCAQGGALRFRASLHGQKTRIEIAAGIKVVSALFALWCRVTVCLSEGQHFCLRARFNFLLLLLYHSFIVLFLSSPR